MAVVQGLYVLPRSSAEYGRTLSPVFARQAVYVAIFLVVAGDARIGASQKSGRQMR